MQLFLIGISGIGMQGLAVILKKQGHDVYGYDDFNHLKSLENIGITYSKTIPKNTDYIIYSSAIKEDHKLIQEAQNLNIQCLNRTDFWLKHMQLNDVIAVAGAHGKTTTCAMLAHIFEYKSYAIGGIINGQTFPANHEESDFTIIETDESDGSFIKWKAKYKILLNFDFEHMDFFKTKENAIEYYRKFAMDTNSIIIIEQKAKKFLEIPDAPNIITFGSRDTDFVFHNIKHKPNGLKFKINNEKIVIPMQGQHNAANFTAIYALLQQINKYHFNIKTFPGVKKRMQIIKQQDDKTFWLDYGHFPTEVQCTLSGLLLHKKIKPIVVLEPHKASRLLDTWNDWPAAFKGYKVFVVKIHSANEEITTSSQKFVEYLQTQEIDASFLSNIDDLKFDDNIICFSAGTLSEKLSTL